MHTLRHWMCRDWHSRLWWRTTAVVGFALLFCACRRCSASDQRASKRQFKANASKGDTDALVALGRKHELGTDGHVNYRKAFQSYFRAAAMSNSDGMVRLGRCYAKGRGVSRDWNMAVTWYRKAEKAKNAEAMNELGTVYQLGRGVRRKSVEAAKWYRKGAEAGSVRAMLNLAVCHRTGRGVNLKKAAQLPSKKQLDAKDAKALLGIDDQEANRWAKKAVQILQQKASDGDVEAMVLLGLACFRGDAVRRDLPRAVNWMSQAAEKGNVEAMVHLARFHLTGTGVKKNVSLYQAWLKKAADRGMPEAMVLLGEFSETSLRQPEDAEKWYRKAAETRDGKGMFRLARILAKNKKEREALKWYRQSAERNFAPALTELGTRYAEGRGVAKDPQKAVENLRKAASGGDKRAAFPLGKALLQQKKVEAIFWLQRAAFHRNDRAAELLSDLYSAGKLIKADAEQARFWKSFAAKTRSSRNKKNKPRKGTTP